MALQRTETWTRDIHLTPGLVHAGYPLPLHTEPAPEEPTDPPVDPTGTVMHGDGSGPVATFTYSNTKGDPSAPFFMENSSGSVLKRDGSGLLYRDNAGDNFRMWLHTPYGGNPGDHLRWWVRLRTSQINAASGGIVEGMKLMAKVVHPEHPYGITNPDAARGVNPWNIGPGGKNVVPGSMYCFSHVDGGRMEISKHHFGTSEYTFGGNPPGPAYSLGDWETVAMDVEWHTDGTLTMSNLRNGVVVNSWRDTGQSGMGNYDGGEPFFQGFFFGLRADRAMFQVDEYGILNMNAVTP